MRPNKRIMSNSKLPISAISAKSRSCAKGAFKGFGEFPNKQQNADFRVSGNPRFAHLWPSDAQDALLAGFSVLRNTASLK